MKIIDNYLNKEDHLVLKEALSSDTFPWFYNEYKVDENKELFNFQFTHSFYRDHTINSNHFECLRPLLTKMKPHSLIRIKANLTTATHKQVSYKEHTDQPFKCSAAIYYINTNNGYTLIKNKKIESKQNRIVFFDADTEHVSTNATDCKNRMVINFNYF